MFNLIFRFTERVLGVVRVIALKSSGAVISGKLLVRSGVDIPRLQNRICFGDRVILDRGVSIILSETPSNKISNFLLVIGNRVYVNRYTIIDATSKIEIGEHTMIGTHCYITDHDHDIKNQPVDKSIGELPIDGIPVSIGRNVWIGSHVVILKGVSIGENSVIGAGSVVTKSIPANCVAVGNPCRVIKDRK